MKTQNSTARVIGSPTRPALTLALLAGLTFAPLALAQPAAPADGSAKVIKLQMPEPGQAPAVNSLTFDEITHDFGRIMDTEQVSHEFRFTNSSDKVIVLAEKFSSSCGCTAAVPEKREYAPGESGTIAVNFNPAGKGGHKNSQNVTVTYTEKDKPEGINPSTTLTIYADVRTAVSIDPPNLVSFGEVLQGDTPTQIVTVTGIDEDFEVTYASIARSRLFGIKILDSQPVEIEGLVQRQTRLELSLKDTSSKGMLNSLATFRTTDKTVPLASVQVQAEVVGDIKVLPPRVNVGAIEVGQPYERMFKVSSRAGKPFTITEIEQQFGEGQRLEIDIKPLEQGDGNGVGYQVFLKGVASAAVGPMTGALIVRTDAPGEEKHEVQVVGAIRPKTEIVLPPSGPMGPFIEPAAPAEPTSVSGPGGTTTSNPGKPN